MIPGIQDKETLQVRVAGLRRTDKRCLQAIVALFCDPEREKDLLDFKMGQSTIYFDGKHGANVKRVFGDN